jgi:hypothetical protein
MKEHAFRRRVNVRALNPANVKGLEEQILKNLRFFCESLTDSNGDEWSSPHNMSKLVGYLISDTMGDVIFRQELRHAEERRQSRPSFIATSGRCGHSFGRSLPRLYTYLPG